MATFGQQLVAAVKADDMWGVRTLLAITNKKTLAAVKVYKLEEAALHHAASKGNNRMVKLLVNAGFDVNSYVVLGLETFRWTALHWAARMHHVSTVKLLLELGANKQLYGYSHLCKGNAYGFAVSQRGPGMARAAAAAAPAAIRAAAATRLVLDPHGEEGSCLSRFLRRHIPCLFDRYYAYF